MTEPLQSRWSYSTESILSRNEVDAAPSGQIKMSEDSVLTRIRRACSPQKKNDFQTLQSVPNSVVEMSPVPHQAPLHNVTSATRSLARNKSNKSTKSKRRLSIPKPKPKPPPKNRTPPTTLTPPKPLSPNISFELTPLSCLIAQSFTDIALLRRLYEVQTPAYPSPVYSPTPRASSSPSSSAPLATSQRGGRGPGNTSPQVQQTLVDFDKVEENLRKFEELYQQFLNYGGRLGDKADEVHLVAVVCKRSDVVKGQVVVTDGSVPRVKRVWVDCGI